MQIVRSGTWLYDGAVEKPVDIVALANDWWYEMARAGDELEPGEEPEPLGPEGRLYYVRFVHAGETVSETWVDSFGHPSVDGAMAAADARAPTPIEWFAT